MASSDFCILAMSTCTSSWPAGTSFKILSTSLAASNRPFFISHLGDSEKRSAAIHDRFLQGNVTRQRKDESQDGQEEDDL